MFSLKERGKDFEQQFQHLKWIIFANSFLRWLKLTKLSNFKRPVNGLRKVNAVWILPGSFLVLFDKKPFIVIAYLQYGRIGFFILFYSIF